MSSEKRRQAILENIKKSHKPVKGSQLAEFWCK